jgi:hypothetical protein
VRLLGTIGIHKSLAILKKASTMVSNFSQKALPDESLASFFAFVIVKGIIHATLSNDPTRTSSA